MAVRNLTTVLAAATYALRAGSPTVAADNDAHLAFGKWSTLTRNNFLMLKIDMDWTSVQKVTGALLHYTTYRPVGDNHLGAVPSSTVDQPFKATLLSGAFTDPDAGSEGVFAAGSYLTTIPKNANYVSNGLVHHTHDHANTVDITGLLDAWAPTTVKTHLDKGGGGLTNRGLVIEARPTASVPSPFAMIYLTGPNAPWIELFFDPIPSPPVVTLTGPPSVITQVSGEFFEGDMVAGTLGDTLKAFEVELYLDGGAIVWQKTRNATASEAESLHFSTPLPSLVKSGIAYEWRARVQNQNDEWSAFSAKTDLLVSTTAPTLSQLSPSGTLETLDSIYFGAHYADANSNKLLEYRIQVADGSLTPSDPLWDTTPYFWDTGVVSASEPERSPGGDSSSGGRQFAVPGTGGIVVDRGGVIRRLYGGSALPPGTYDYRIKAWDELGAQSLWYYGTFTLTKGWEPDPGETEFLTGYADRQVKVRVLIKDMDLNQQRFYIHNASGGTFKIDLDGQITGVLNYNASAADVKTALEALSNVSTVTVTKVGTFYTIDFDPADNIDTVIKGNSLSLTGTGATVHFWHTRGPGKVIGEIDDAANIGAGEFYNSAGEFFFTLPAIHPQVSVIEPWQVHWALEVYRGEGWKEINAGLIVDFDATDDDVVFVGFDYMGVGALDVDERFNPEATPDLAAVMFPTLGGGTKYVNKDIDEVVTDQLNRMIYGIKAPLGFMTLGTVDNMDEKVTIFSTFKQRIPFVAGLIESHRAGTGKRTRVRIRKLITGKYEIRVDDNPGVDRDNLLMAYGELVQGFRAIPFGDFGTRINAVGRAFNALKVDYVVQPTPVPTGEPADYNEAIYGRVPQARLWQDITDLNDLKRRAKQEAKRLGKVGKALGLGLRVDALGVKDGWDICDSIPVDIQRGVVHTDRFGSGYWTIWGWTFRVYPDGHTDLVLSILPREDDEAADVDLIPSSPISTTPEWDIGWKPPVAGVQTVRFWLDQNTGIVYERQPDGSYSPIDAPGGSRYPGVPSAPTIIGVATVPTRIRVDGPTGTGVRVTLTQATTEGSRGSLVQVTTREVSPGVADWTYAQSAEVPLPETQVTFDALDPGVTAYVRAKTRAVFGSDSAWTATSSVAVGTDTTAPAVPTGLIGVNGILSIRAAWTANTEDDFNHYDVQVDDDPAFGSPFATYSVDVNSLVITGLTAGVWNVRVRAVDHTGNASAYSAGAAATARTVQTADVTNLAIDVTKIADDSISTPKLQALSVDAAKIAAGAVTAGKLDITNFGTGEQLPDGTFDWLGVGDTRYWSLAAEWSVSPAGAGSVYTRGRYRLRCQPTATAQRLASNLGKVKIADYSLYSVAIEHAIEAYVAGTLRVSIQQFTTADALIATNHLMSFSATKVFGTDSVIIAGPSAVVPTGLTPALTLDPTCAYIMLRLEATATANVSNWWITAVAITQGTVANMGSSPSTLYGGMHGDAGGLIIYDGKIIFKDNSGSTALTGAGFGATWQRFLQSGFFNGDFVALPPTPGSDISDATNPLPNWPFTKSSGTAITARSVADTAAGSQRALQFTMAAGAANDKSYIEQLYPLVASKNRAFSFSPYAFVTASAGSADAEVFIELQYLKQDLTTTGANMVAFFATNAIGAGGLELGLGSGHDSQPPANAYYARVRYGLRRRSGGSNAATSTIQFSETAMVPGLPRVHIPEITSPGTYSRASIGQFNGQISILPDSLVLSGTARKAVYLDGFLAQGGTSFPTNPATSDLYFRTDHGMWFRYDGTRWLCTCLHEVLLHPQTGSLSVTTITQQRTPLPHSPWGGNIYVVDAEAIVNVAAGGTALGASHKWVATLRREVAAGTFTTIATLNLDSGASGVWRRINAASVNTVVDLTNFAMVWDYTKTGTPGNTVWLPKYTYRFIAT